MKEPVEEGCCDGKRGLWVEICEKELFAIECEKISGDVDGKLEDSFDGGNKGGNNATGGGGGGGRNNGSALSWNHISRNIMKKLNQ